jgi:ABC-type transport system involved in multi-copper enzyme maturation permease subunit
MKLELRKFRMGFYIRSAMIANIMILGLVCFMSLNPEIQEDLSLTNYSIVFTIIDTLVRGTYIVFAAVLISNLVIDEFRTKSIMLLFMYPINRKKLIAAKLIIILLFTLIANIAGNLLVGAGFLAVNLFTPLISGPLTTAVLSNALLMMLMSAVVTGFMGLIPLYVGMRKYSTAATIVSSLLIVAIVCQTVSGVTLYSFIAVPVGLAFLGAAIAYMAIRNIESIDVL